MINVDLVNMQKCTYRRLLSRLSEIQLDTLANLENAVTRAIEDAVFVGKWSVDNIRIDNFDLLKLIIIELQMKGFKAWYVSQDEPVILKDGVVRNHYYTLYIKWELEN